MKPEDLKSPFRWDERHILLEDRVLYVPDYYTDDQFTLPAWNDPVLFGNPGDVNVEYCSGNGAWVAAKAKEDITKNWVAIELKFGRVRKIWSKIKNFRLTNLFVVCGEGNRVTKDFFQSATVSQIFINFPDPWPKKRHAKHRIIQPHFVEEMCRILKPDGMLTFVTDDPDYSDWTIEHLLQHPGFSSVHPSPFYITDLPNYGDSYFDALWRSKGKVIRYHQFRKKS